MTRYVSRDTTTLYQEADPSKVLIELLWGDTVFIEDEEVVDGKQKVRARACTGWVKAADLMDEPLLELYFIDVGQGDSVLIVTPDRQHILLDGGYPRVNQNHGKSGADFVDWKFKRDYGKDVIDLDMMIASHNDADHYGGLWDLLNPAHKDKLDIKETRVRKFRHAGVSWWKNDTVKRSLGRKEGGFLVDIIDDKASVERALKMDAARGYQLQGEWAEFMQCVVNSCDDIRRIGYDAGGDVRYLDGFGEESEVRISVLGPIVHNDGDGPRIRSLGDDSQNTNGNSILLRLDYGRTRILLTGDLNKASQQDILREFGGRRQELAADVIKSCHHGSDDCSYEFLATVHASATIISSGDTETHAHPRPNIVAASGLAGFQTLRNDELVTPLVYSTEISRSTRTAEPTRVLIDDAEHALRDVVVTYEETASGGRSPKTGRDSLEDIRVVAGIVYGLVNVRTDGSKILCATRNEGKGKWDIKKFKSRF
jgi:beta-lactamase superfamily II metal-dependent hydrolase